MEVEVKRRKNENHRQKGKCGKDNESAIVRKIQVNVEDIGKDGESGSHKARKEPTVGSKTADEKIDIKTEKGNV